MAASSKTDSKGAGCTFGACGNVRTGSTITSVGEGSTPTGEANPSDRQADRSKHSAVPSGCSSAWLVGRKMHGVVGGVEETVGERDCCVCGCGSCWGGGERGRAGGGC